MQKAGDILADLGFSQDAPESTQKAFLKNLIKAAYGDNVEALPVEVKRPIPQQQKQEPFKKAAGSTSSSEQLSFDLEKAFND